MSTPKIQLWSIQSFVVSDVPPGNETAPNAETLCVHEILATTQSESD